MDLAMEIGKLKAEKNAFLLAHNYQLPEVQLVADFVGDSLEMARKAVEADACIIVVAGVDFMAETAKVLNQESKVLITSKDAVCPMAAMLKKGDLEKAKQAHPDADTVLYVNTTAECRALADRCCTSANAVEVVNSMGSSEVLFGPDANLARHVQKNSEKSIIPIPVGGRCYVHANITLADLERAKAEHPVAKVIAHPECLPGVQDAADFIGSTSQMIAIAGREPAEEFIIATETGMLWRLGQELPKKRFHAASNGAVCGNMKQTGLQAVYNALKNEVHEVNVPVEIAEMAAAAMGHGSR